MTTTHGNGLSPAPSVFGKHVGVFRLSGHNGSIIPKGLRRVISTSVYSLRDMKGLVSFLAN